jgi:hypothetical protein
VLADHTHHSSFHCSYGLVLRVVWDIGGGVVHVIYAVTGIRSYYGIAAGPRMRLTVPNN